MIHKRENALRVDLSNSKETLHTEKNEKTCNKFE